MCAWKKTGGDGHDFQEAARAAAAGSAYQDAYARRAFLLAREVYR